MNTLAVISIPFHVIGLILYGICWWERDWWRNEAEALQLVHHRNSERLRAMIRECDDIREECESWERKAACLWGEMKEEAA